MDGNGYTYYPCRQGFFPPPPGMSWYTIGCQPQNPNPPPPSYPQSTLQQPNLPGMNLPNHQNGTGNPFGYNFIFPQSVTVIHVLRSSRPPWQLSSPSSSHPSSSSAAAIEMIPCTVPTMLTVKELMKSLGCDNEDPAKNVLYEVTRADNGTWKKGIMLNGGMVEEMKKNLLEFGWGENRNGVLADYVWLYLTKD